MGRIAMELKQSNKNNDTGGAFLTQKGEKINEVKNEISELEQLLAAAGQTSQSTLLLKKRKEVREVDESLELMKLDYKKRMDICEQRRVQFELKQSKMRDQVLKFEKFIQENDAKRLRAELKAKQEKKNYEDKIKEIVALTDKLQILEQEQKTLNDELAKKSCFKLYLERIIEEGEFGYEEISEILNRHYTLVEANKDLVRHASEREREVDELRRNLQNMRIEKQNQLLVSTSLIQQNQKNIEKLRIDLKYEEDMKLKHDDKIKDVSKELSETIAAIKNLFGRCSANMKSKPIFNGNKEAAQLEEILDFELDIVNIRLVDLKEISTEYKTILDSTLPLPPVLDTLGSISIQPSSSQVVSKM